MIREMLRNSRLDKLEDKALSLAKVIQSYVLSAIRGFLP